MTPERLSQVIGENQFSKFKFHCYDCNDHTVVSCERTGPLEINISGGSIFEPPLLWDIEDQFIGKCDKCHQENPAFNPPAAIYSRVVGYMRPVQSWNNAKQEEFKLRKTYQVSS